MARGPRHTTRAILPQNRHKVNKPRHPEGPNQARPCRSDLYPLDFLHCYGDPEIDPVQALDVQRDMPVEHVIDRHDPRPHTHLRAQEQGREDAPTPQPPSSQDHSPRRSEAKPHWYYSRASELIVGCSYSVASVQLHATRGEAMWELTDQAFTGVQPLLPAPSRRGKPCRDHRQVLGGILWKLHTGAPWRDVPQRFGPWQTCYSRLRRWQRDGTWPKVWTVLAAGEHGSPHNCRGQASKAAAPVAAARAGLMATPPPRPPQHLPEGRRCPPHQRGQQPARFGGRDPDQVRAEWLWQFCAFSRPPVRAGCCASGPLLRPAHRRWRGPPPGTRAPPSPG
jgi:transposase